MLFVMPSHGGIPSPSGGIVGKGHSTGSKTTVGSKRVGPLGSNGAPLLLDPIVLSFYCCLFILTEKSLTRKMYYVLLFYLVYPIACFDFFKNGKGVGCSQI